MATIRTEDGVTIPTEAYLILSNEDASVDQKLFSFIDWYTRTVAGPFGFGKDQVRKIALDYFKMFFIAKGEHKRWKKKWLKKFKRANELERMEREEMLERIKQESKLLARQHAEEAELAEANEDAGEGPANIECEEDDLDVEGIE